MAIPIAVPEINHNPFDWMSRISVVDHKDGFRFTKADPIAGCASEV
jgi:hypothetical protein